MSTSPIWGGEIQVGATCGTHDLVRGMRHSARIPTPPAEAGKGCWPGVHTTKPRLSLSHPSPGSYKHSSLGTPMEEELQGKRTASLGKVATAWKSYSLGFTSASSSFKVCWYPSSFPALYMCVYMHEVSFLPHSLHTSQGQRTTHRWVRRHPMK